MGWQDDEIVSPPPSATPASSDSPWLQDEIVKPAPESTLQAIGRHATRTAKNLAEGAANVVAGIPEIPVNIGLALMGQKPLITPGEVVGKGFDTIFGTEGETAPRSAMERITDAATQAIGGGGGAATAKAIAAGAAPLAVKSAGDVAALGTAGAAGQGASEVAQNVAPNNRTVNTLAPFVGGMVGAAGAHATVKSGDFAYKAATGEVSPEAQTLIDKAKQYGIELPTNAVPGSPAWTQAAYDTLQKVPGFLGGTSGKAAELQQQTAGAAEKYTKQQQSAMIDANFGSMGAVTKAASTEGPRQKAAQAVLDRMNNAVDMPDIVKADADGEALRKNLISDKQYTDVERLAGNVAVPLEKTNAVLDSEISALQDRHGTAVNAALSTLQKLKSDFNSPVQVGKGKTALVDSQGNPLTTGENAKPNTYSNLRATASTLYKQSEDAAKGNDSASGTSLIKVYGALKDDLSAFPQKTGNIDLQRAATKADTYYKENVVPMQAKQLDALYDRSPDAEGDRVYSGLIKAGNYGDRAQKFYGSLSDKGRAAVRYGMAQDAQSSATDETGNFNTQKYLKSLHDRQAATGVFFRGTDKFELDGYTNVLKNVASSAKQTGTPGGHAAVGAVGIGEAAHAGVSPAMGVGALLTSHGTKWLLTSPAGRNLLLRASSLPPSSPAMSKLVDQIRMAVPTMGTQAAKGSATSNPGQ